MYDHTSQCGQHIIHVQWCIFLTLILAPHSLQQAVRVRAHSLYIPFTFTAHSPYILINCAFAVYSLHNHIHCIFTITACSLQVHFHCTFPSQSLYMSIFAAANAVSIAMALYQTGLILWKCYYTSQCQNPLIILAATGSFNHKTHGLAS